MRSEKSMLLYSAAQRIAEKLYEITITDAWYQEGGNIETASQASQKHSMAAVLAGIKATGGHVQAKKGIIRQGVESWLDQGRRTLSFRKGICTDCAAAATVRFLEFLYSTPYAARVEIISTTTHAFVVVNKRRGHLHNPRAWGSDAFIIDIWYQNQFPRGHANTVCWANDFTNPIIKFIQANAWRLRVESDFSEFIETITDPRDSYIPSVPPRPSLRRETQV